MAGMNGRDGKRDGFARASIYSYLSLGYGLGKNVNLCK